MERGWNWIMAMCRERRYSLFILVLFDIFLLHVNLFIPHLCNYWNLWLDSSTSFFLLFSPDLPHWFTHSNQISCLYFLHFHSLYFHLFTTTYNKIIWFSHWYKAICLIFLQDTKSRIIAWPWVFRVESCLWLSRGFLGLNPAPDSAVSFQARNVIL